MQRRLALAFALIALTAVVLVGLGILLLAQRGARQEAAQQLTAEMEAITDLLSGNRSIRNFGPALLRSQQAFGFEYLQLAVIDSDGELVVVVQPEPQRDRRPALVPADPPSGLPTDLTEDQLAGFEAGEVVIIDDRRAVFALAAIDLRLDRVDRPSLRPTLVGGQRVAPLPNRIVGWFLASSVVVLLGAAAAGAWLARRMVRPIHDLQRTTASLAAGNLDARTEVDGDDELADLARSVNSMAGELQRSRQLDQQFLMSISHDLRTPLTAIGGYGEALVDGTATDPRTVGRVIVGQAGRLERLVQDLLDLARLEAKQFTLRHQNVDLGVVTGRSVAAMTAPAANEGIDLRFHRRDQQSLTVSGDPDRLTQIVNNLIDNALKFARSSVEVTAVRDGHWAVITVADDGPGISEIDLPRIFDRLYAGQLAPRRAESSVGLGLTIVKELVTAMNGSVEVDNRPGGGSEFVVRLPLIDV
ncbi:MAG: HAMP domain-containing histidine kinase [Acidimicrobiia bacterium]|nr:HAMP domain-containing histidine kinase [Acidimicrobiia bacterium]